MVGERDLSGQMDIRRKRRKNRYIHCKSVYDIEWQSSTVILMYGTTPWTFRVCQLNCNQNNKKSINTNTLVKETGF